MELQKILKVFTQNSHRASRIFIIVIISILILFFIGGIIVNLPVLLLISVYALILSNSVLIFNKKSLNSLSIPLTFNYFFVMIYDFSQNNLLFAFFHLVTVIPCFIIIFRLNVSLIIMLSSSIIYAFWIISIEIFLDFHYYECIFYLFDLTYHFLIVLFVGIFTLLMASNNKLKRFALNYLKNKINYLKK
jgi:hypothetical protein